MENCVEIRRRDACDKKGDVVGVNTAGMHLRTGIECIEYEC